MRLTSQDHLLDILEENYLKVLEETRKNDRYL
jgi:hypothetical protein